MNEVKAVKQQVDAMHDAITVLVLRSGVQEKVLRDVIAWLPRIWGGEVSCTEYARLLRNCIDAIGEDFNKREEAPHREYAAAACR